MDPETKRLATRLTAELKRHLGTGPLTARELAAKLCEPDPPTDLISSLEDLLLWAAKRQDQRRLVYEGSVYRRPLGRGLTLEDTAIGSEMPLDLSDWVEAWIDESGIMPAYETGRLRITVEYLGDRDPRRSSS